MNSTALPTVASFDGTNLNIIDRNGTPWLTAADLSRALKYTRPDAVSRIYERNRAEFSDDMTGTVNLTVPNQHRQIPVRIFSPRGCHLIAMFAHTPKAAAFRRWVLDVLEGLAVPRPIAPPKPEPAPTKLAHAFDYFPFHPPGVERDHKAADQSLHMLKLSISMYVEDQRARAHMTEYAEHIGQCLVRCLTEVTEAQTLLHVAGTYLKRWKGPRP